MAADVRYEAVVEAGSQLTLPAPIVDALGMAEGDRLRVDFAPDEPDTILLHRIRTSYAGALSGVFEDRTDYLAAEHASWRRDTEKAKSRPRRPGRPGAELQPAIEDPRDRDTLMPPVVISH